MQALPPALAPLAAFAQFVLFILVPSKTRAGKTDKFPVDHRTGQVCNAHDRGAWTTFDVAAAAVAAGRGHGVGFVFADTDPFFFIDIDKALQPDGAWSDVANYLCAAFPGAAVEVSQSGTGLHIIATGAAAAGVGHRCKNIPLNLEFYTTERFVALTGVNAVGNAAADMSVVVPWLIANYFPPVPEVEGEAMQWGEGPRADWRGPVDDEDLIRRALRSKSAAAVFGGKATFADLWECNVAMLATAYPHADQAFDASSADAALASHLAFWTGCDMERMERLMRRSGLVRDKWERDDYLRKFTIPNAVAVQRDVCRDEPTAPALAPVATHGTVEDVTGGQREGETFLDPARQAELFAGCVYVQDPHRVFIPSGDLLRPDQFKTLFGGYAFTMDRGNEKVSRNAWEAFTESQVLTCPKVHSTCFRPDLATGAVITFDGRRYVNTYVAIATPRTPGDATPFLSHMAKLLPDERDRTILLSYMAACVQHKGYKFQWCPLIQGDEGNGKSLFSRCVSAALGERYTHWPRADQISAKFNAWQQGKLFIGVEDVYLPEDRGDVIEILKPMITNDRQPVEPKGVDQITVWVCNNYILNSNHKDAIRKTRSDRRFAPFYCQQQEDAEWIERDGMGGNYFPALYGWLKSGGYAVVCDLLHTYAIPDEFNPATLCQRAPLTTSTAEAVTASRSGVEQEIIEAIDSGTPGFMGGWISSLAFARLLDKLNRSRGVTYHKREQLLRRLGYVKHPGLVNGRVNNPIAPDAGKPVLFVRADSNDRLIEGAADIARAYSLAQGVAIG